MVKLQTKSNCSLIIDYTKPFLSNILVAIYNFQWRGKVLGNGLVKFLSFHKLVSAMLKVE